MVQNLGEVVWKVLYPPVYWDKAEASILVDGHTEWGLRIHIVDKEQPPTIINNALVLSSNHLSEKVA